MASTVALLGDKVLCMNKSKAKTNKDCRSIKKEIAKIYRIANAFPNSCPLVVTKRPVNEVPLAPSSSEKNLIVRQVLQMKISNRSYHNSCRPIGLRQNARDFLSDVIADHVRRFFLIVDNTADQFTSRLTRSSAALLHGHIDQFFHQFL